ncbi:type IV toxin-antitoxin system AbiEi family antitoxin domain-containing protein [Rhizosphaericola mali]|uniref:Transcriptional regulator, AbiEi antitoxin, Type IV TA system n=1 Tax=Rhizosphaericola mali TaxID=2545455 RepID=A0A5P2G2E6_9BACT|nr:hypothetical protein [Rhizosphaericola mali]QES88888.1 hypothetical protein E0W69_009540 [Rhizosphaericola mali]
MILPFQSQPISHQVLMSLLKDYKRPNDKINELVKDDKLIPLKRGVYIWNSAQQPENFTIANALYGPSYISVESALSFHSIIPEQVFGITSMTTKQSKVFDNRICRFEYKHLTTPYFSFGIKQEKLREDQFALVACSEKALFDKIITTSGILFRSEQAASEFLLENMRMDEEQLKSFDIEMMQSWIIDAPKKESLSFTIKAIEKL